MPGPPGALSRFGWTLKYSRGVRNSASGTRSRQAASRRSVCWVSNLPTRSSGLIRCRPSPPPASGPNTSVPNQGTCCTVGGSTPLAIVDSRLTAFATPVVRPGWKVRHGCCFQSGGT